MKTITCEVAQKLFLFAKKAEGLSAKTLRDYNVSTDRFINDMQLSDVPITNVGKLVVQQWIISLRQSIPNNNSVNKLIRDVRVFIYWIFCEYDLPRFQIKCVHYQESTPKHYTEEELKTILIHQPNIRNSTFVTQRTYAMIAFMLATGARASTVLDLRVGDIDYNRQTVVYRHTKNGKTQIIPLSSSICKILMQYSMVNLSGAPTEAYLYPNSDGGQLALPTFEHHVKRFVEDCGVHSRGIHAFRHSFARYYILYNNGGAFQLQQFLGHSDVSVTKRYVRIFGTDLSTDGVPLDMLMV